jgi:hypothetical protein
MSGDYFKLFRRSCRDGNNRTRADLKGSWDWDEVLHVGHQFCLAVKEVLKVDCRVDEVDGHEEYYLRAYHEGESYWEMRVFMDATRDDLAAGNWAPEFFYGPNGLARYLSKLLKNNETQLALQRLAEG